MNKLSSGSLIVKTSDNAASLQISEKMRNELRMSTALSTDSSRVAQDGISKLQTAEAGLKAIEGALSKMKEFTVKSNDNKNLADTRESVDNRIKSLKDEIDGIVINTTYNLRSLLDGSFDETLEVQNGDDENKTLHITINSMYSKALGLAEDKAGEEDIATKPDDMNAESIDQSIQTVSGAREQISGWQKQLEDSINSILPEEAKNWTNDLENRVKNGSMGKEIMNAAMNRILNDPTTAMLVQANQQAQGIMALLR